MSIQKHLEKAAEAEYLAMHAAKDTAIEALIQERDNEIKAVKDYLEKGGIQPSNAQLERWLKIYQPN